MMNKQALLVLADGTSYPGLSIGADGDAVGELVFNTSMTGYQEMLTDPSYAQQLITLTAAHVGNTGCNSEDMESNRVWAAGLILRDYSYLASNYRSEHSLSDFLHAHKVVAIAGIDTRALTLKIREEGAIAACITTRVDNPKKALARAQAFTGLQGLDLASVVSRQTMERWYAGQGSWRTLSPTGTPKQIVVYDFGIKHSILRILYDSGCHITLVPAKTPASEVLAMHPDGVVLSNGPGDPKACDYAIAAAKIFLAENIPLFGICLGFQILALACGASTKKMQCGHHGANHPVVAIEENRRVFITSQNHGFAVDEASLPDCLQITHKSLFDGSLQGIRHKTKSAFGFQGHPEASPGPHDISGLFSEFIDSMLKESGNE